MVLGGFLRTVVTLPTMLRREPNNNFAAVMFSLRWGLNLGLWSGTLLILGKVMSDSERCMFAFAFNMILDLAHTVILRSFH